MLRPECPREVDHHKKGGDQWDSGQNGQAEQHHDLRRGKDAIVRQAGGGTKIAWEVTGANYCRPRLAERNGVVGDMRRKLDPKRLGSGREDKRKAEKGGPLGTNQRAKRVY